MLVLVFIVSAFASKESCQDALMKDASSLFNPQDVSSSDISALLNVYYSGKDVNDLGHYSSCISQENSNYLLVTYVTPQRPIRGGLCVPSDCDAISLNEVFAANNITNVSIQDTFESEVETGTIILVVILSLLVLLAMIGTIIDLTGASEQTAVDIELQELNKQSDQSTRRSPVSETLKSFSLVTTWKGLVSPPVQDNSAVLNGARFFSMCWVILGHTYALRLFLIQNLEDLPSIIEWKTSLIAIMGIHSVDTFFWIGGFLVGYLTLKELTRRKRLPWGLVIFLRYIRLIPAYATMIAVSYWIFPYIIEGPLFADYYKALKADCDKYWWTNALFLNNFLPDGKGSGCFVHSWYLANDMQMFLFSLILIYTYYKFPAFITWILSVIYMIIEFSIRFEEAAQYNFKFSVISPNNSTSEYFRYLYMKPYCRYSPYLLGLMCGFVYLRYKNQDNGDPIANFLINVVKKTQWIWLILGWALFQAMIFLQGYCADDGENAYSGFSDSTNVFLVGIVEIYVGICYSLIFLPLLLGKMRFVSGMLGWSVWSTLAKLTYSTYLAHISIMYFVYGRDSHVMTWTSMTIMSDVLFFVCISLVGGTVLYFLVESPCNELIRNRLKGKQRVKTQSK